MRRPRIIRHDRAEECWRVVHGDAAPWLRPHVEAYADYGETTPSFVRRRELPSLRPTLILNLGAPIGILDKAGTRFGIGTGQGFLAGLHDCPAFSESPGSQRGVHIWLSALGAAALLGEVMASLANQVVVLRDVLGPDADSLAACLIEAEDSERRFALLDAFFERRLADAARPCPKVTWAWDRLVTAPAPRIDRLAREIGWSQRRLAAGFVRHVGHPPRPIVRLARFRRLIARIDDGWAQRGLDAGYFDQPHLIHEFRALAGMTPRRYAARLLPDGGGLVED